MSINELFIKFEDEAMKLIIEENPEHSDRLLLQYQQARIKKRDFSGCGFFTYFSVANNLRLPNNDNLELGNLQADINDIKHGVGFVLFIRDGLLTMLEGFTYDEKWPVTLKKYYLHY